MALEVVGGALFTMLYDGVKKAVSKNSTFKSLLGDLKSTLDSLERRDIQQIEEHNVELDLPNDEIECLKMQMEEGVKLVTKLSNFGMWKFCCLGDCTDQIVELNRALKRLLEKLKMQEIRDVKALLLLSRQNRDTLDEMNRRQLDIQKLLQQIAGQGGSGLENLVSGSNTETAPPEQTQGNGGEQVTSFDGGASLEAVFLSLFDAVIGAKDKTVMFKPQFENLISTLESLKPLIEEVTKHKEILDGAEERLDDFRIQMENGVELIDKRAKDHWWARCKQYKYTDKLLRLDESLQKLLNILKVQLARDVKQTFASVQHIKAVIKQIEESGVLQDQIQTRGRNALPESLSPTVGLDMLNERGTRDVKEALLSVRNKKAVAEKTEGSGVVQNQSEIEGLRSSSKLSTISVPSTFRTEGEIVQSSSVKEFGHIGSVFKGWVDENSLTAAKPGTGMVVAVKKEGLLNSADLVAQTQIQNLITTRYAAPYLPSNTLWRDAQLAKIKMKLLTGNAPSMLVLTAPSGRGKTYLAKMLCHDEQVKDKFMDNIFFTTVSENPNIDVQEFFQHAGFRLPALENDEIAAGQTPFLLILDDVPSTSESLLHEFNQINISDSKILVTSRCHFPKFGSPCELQGLSNDDAETLFCRSAFPPNTSFNKGDYQEELKEIVNHCKKFPLAITTIGGSLCNQPIEKWRLKCTELCQGSILELEESLLVVLQSCLDDLNKGRATIKDCFKDLGLFPKNQRIPVAALRDMWAELYEGSNDNMSMVNLYELTIRNLARIAVTRNKGMDGYYGEHFVVQHDMLKLLSIHESSADPIGRRLIIDLREDGLPTWWTEQKKKTKKARLISVSTGESSSTEWHNMDLPQGEVLVLNFQAKNYALPKFMKKMCKLKVLIVTNDGFSPTELSDFELLCSVSNLKRLRLERISIPLISNNIIPSKSLKKISLFMCKVSRSFGNSSIQIFETFPFLEELHIDYCNDLEELPAKLCDLIRLKVLSITNCHKLSVLPEDIGKLENLEVLRLRSCTNLEKLPGWIWTLSKLYFLDIYNCSGIKELPECIGKMNGLRKINMAQCSRLNVLPVSVYDLDQQLEKVICDEDTRYLWESVLSNPDKIMVAKEEFNLNWLHRLQI